MGLKEDIQTKIREFKAEQKRRNEFKKELDFEKFKALEVARAKQEIKDVKAGKKKEGLLDEFDLDPQKITVFDTEMVK